MSELHIVDQPLPGVYLLDCPCFFDQRGEFTKLFHADSLLSHGVSFAPAELFLTRSKRGVLRGMHFQVGQSSHDKLVACIQGSVLDVVVDVRPDSNTFNKPFSIELSESNNRALLISKGYAHGFLSLADNSSMIYSTTTVHNPLLDRGVRWDSIAFDWPIDNPLLSNRDKSHISINQCQEEF